MRWPGLHVGGRRRSCGWGCRKRHRRVPGAREQRWNRLRGTLQHGRLGNTGGSSSAAGAGVGHGRAGGPRAEAARSASDAGPGLPDRRAQRRCKRAQQEGLSCQYGKCCPTMPLCGGKWQIALTDCAVPGCPATAPTQGASCTCVNTPLPCHYECATVAKSIDATCVNDVWSTRSPALCGSPVWRLDVPAGRDLRARDRAGAGSCTMRRQSWSRQAARVHLRRNACPAGTVCGVSEHRHVQLSAMP